MGKHQQNIDLPGSDKATWLANQIFTAFPQEVTSLKFYILDCGCIYYQRVFRDGDLDPQVSIYSDAENGPCEICMQQEESWKERVVEEAVVYTSKFQVDSRARRSGSYQFKHGLGLIYNFQENRESTGVSGLISNGISGVILASILAFLLNVSLYLSNK